MFSHVGRVRLHIARNFVSLRAMPPLLPQFEAPHCEAQLRVQRVTVFSNEVVGLLEEYYAAATVQQQDGPETIRQVIEDASSGFWVAYLNGEVAGCVLLKARNGYGECKRLYVRPACRRGGVAHALMDAVEAFATGTSLAWVYLDTIDTMQAAVALYRARGYVACERFNDNPQANLFLRKAMVEAVPVEQTAKANSLRE
jgi:ribosomal protein S18 acetylase RimI-like enzyme